MTSARPFSAEASVRCESIFDKKAPTVEDQLQTDFRLGAQDFMAARRWAAQIKLLPESRRENFVRMIGKLYRQIPKKNPSPTAPWHIGGRRLFDYLINGAENYHDRFQESVARGTTPADAYRRFLDHQKEVFGVNYGADEIFSIVRILQTGLRAVPSNGYPNKLILAGSFMNGKASLVESDIDMSVNPPSLLRSVPDWQTKINEELQKSRPEAKLTIEAHGEPAGFYGKLNPFVIEISADKIRILVFPTAFIGNPNSELIPGQPSVYELGL